jgi:hypothetical protein
MKRAEEGSGELNLEIDGGGGGDVDEGAGTRGNGEEGGGNDMCTIYHFLSLHVFWIVDAIRCVQDWLRGNLDMPFENEHHSKVKATTFTGLERYTPNDVLPVHLNP